MIFCLMAAPVVSDSWGYILDFSQRSLQAKGRIENPIWQSIFFSSLLVSLAESKAPWWRNRSAKRDPLLNGKDRDPVQMAAWAGDSADVE